jgi:hypothetical protein
MEYVKAVKKKNEAAKTKNDERGLFVMKKAFFYAHFSNHGINLVQFGIPFTKTVWGK